MNRRSVRSSRLFVCLLLVPAMLGAAADPNRLRWEGHEAALDHAVAWQQEDRDGRWVTYVLLTDRQVPASALTKPNLADRSSPDEWITELDAQALLFAVTTGGIPMPDGAVFSIWYRDGTELRQTHVTGSGGFDIESLTPGRIKGRAVAGLDTDQDGYWSVGFDAAIAGGKAPRMAAEGEALGPAGGQPGKDLAAALDATRKKDLAAVKSYASPEMVQYLDGLTDPTELEQAMTMRQVMAGAGQRILNGVRVGDRASVYWVKTPKDPKGRNLRCTDNMFLQDGRWRSTQSSCGAE